MQTRSCGLDDLKSSPLVPGGVRGEVPAVAADPLGSGAQAKNLAPLRDSMPPAVTVPRLALSKRDAALAISVSVDFLEEHVLGELRVVRRGRKVLVPVKELERWLERSAALTVGER